MSLFGVEFSAIMVALTVLIGLLGLFAAMALFARNYIKVPPSMVAIFYGRKHTLIDEKGNRTTVGFRVVRWRRGFTGSRPGKGRVPLAQHYLDPAENLSRVHQGRCSRDRGGSSQRQDCGRRHVPARCVRAFFWE
jgi:hypothetical protein